MIPRAFIQTEEVSTAAWAGTILEDAGYEVFTALDNVSRETIESCHLFIVGPMDSEEEKYARERSKMIVTLFRFKPGSLACARSESDLKDIVIRVKPLCGEMIPPSAAVAEQLACIQAAYLK